MIRKSISNIELLKLIDEDDERVYYGCDQEWYPTKWQRQSGCGPTTACNILLYWNVAQNNGSYTSKEHGVSLMEEVWEHITPTKMGIPTADMFCQYIDKYAHTKGLNIKCQMLNIQSKLSARVDMKKIIAFIEDSLDKDMPVAFLNLSNGKLKELESWHWVTIASIEYEPDGSSVYVYTVDGGMLNKINFKLWYDTSKLGGGLVHLNVEA